MKNLLAVIAITVLLIIAAVLISKISDQPASFSPTVAPMQPEPIVPRQVQIGDDAIWFDMSYRGLTGEQGAMRYGFAMGFGKPNHLVTTPFTKSVREQAKNDVHTVYNRYFKDRTLSVIETDGREAKLFYFDCDGNGKLSDDEIFAPVNTREYANSKEYVFVTSDFVEENTAGKTVLLRSQLRASFYEGRDAPSCMWSPACILEGEADVEGCKARLILFMGGLSGDYTQFGRASYALLDAEQGDMEYPPMATLSSLIFHNDKFYQLRFDGSCEEGKTLRVALVPDTSPTGDLAVDIKGQEDLKAKVSYATVKGASDKSIHFAIRDSQQFPVDQYVLESGQLEYNNGGDTNWFVSFSEGPEFSIAKGETFALELGEPKLAVISIDEGKRYSSEAEECDTFGTHDRIYLAPKIVGLTGEVYSRFRKHDKAGGGRFEDIKPHLTITNGFGKELVSKDLEYG